MIERKMEILGRHRESDQKRNNGENGGAVGEGCGEEEGKSGMKRRKRKQEDDILEHGWPIE